MIDSIHKEVFELINQIAKSICARDIPALLEAFAILEQGLVGYFAVEEKIAQAAGFDFGKHRLAHQFLLEA